MNYSEKVERARDVCMLAKVRPGQGLGRRQIAVLRSLCIWGYWPGTGWTYGTTTETSRILDSLAARGLVDTEQVPAKDFYGHPYPAGHHLYGKTTTRYRPCQWARDIMSGKEIQSIDTKAVAAQ